MRGRDEAVAQIEVRMLRFPRPGGDEVHVHVEDARVGEWPQTAESRFFLDLPQGDHPRIPLSLAVPARLQPSIQAAVMEEEDVLADPTHFLHRRLCQTLWIAGKRSPFPGPPTAAGL